jgi:hypothetical protein
LTAAEHEAATTRLAAAVERGLSAARSEYRGRVSAEQWNEIGALILTAIVDDLGRPEG